MKRDSIYRSLTIALPLAAFLCATGATVFEWQRLRGLDDETNATVSRISQIDRELQSYEAQPQNEKVPTIAKAPREQAQFLDALRANADVCKVQLVRWSNVAPPAPTSSTTADKSATALPPGVAAIISVIEVTGQADNTRQFLYNIIRSHRLLNMSDIKWVRDTWPNTHLTCTLTRYVGPPILLPAGRPGLDRQAVDIHGRSPLPGVVESPSITANAGPAIGTDHPDRMSLPNPMDAPGIAHGAYQSRLEAGVSQLNEMAEPRSSASPHPGTVTNAKH